jgi:glucose/arabinose dehydrogenase
VGKLQSNLAHQKIHMNIRTHHRPLATAARSPASPKLTPARFGIVRGPNRSAVAPGYFVSRVGRARHWFAAAALCFLAGNAHAQLVSTVVMQGLENPRALAFSADGSLYVTEAGTPITPVASTLSLTVRGETFFFGTTGAISRLSAGVQSRVLTSLPMLYSPTSGTITGAHGIGFSAAGDMYFTVGLGANPAQRTGPMSALGLLMRLPAASGTPQVVADISAFEGANNPDAGLIDTNPYQLAVLSDRVLIADSGANAVLQTSFAGVTSLVTVLPPTPSGGEPVPTGIAVGSDGLAYASQLTSAPFPRGSASVYRLDSAAPTKVATGFTNAIDLKLGPDGLLYVIEITHNGLTSGSPTGGLWQINPQTGASTLLMTDGLTRPTALAFDRAGNLYIADRGVIPGAGQVLRITAEQLTKSTLLLAPRGILNAATRGRTGTGADPLILGFVVGVDTKQMLIRGVGPGLAPYGISAPVSDPKITLYDSAGRIVAENDNWSSGSAASTAALMAATSKTGAFPFTANSLDAALLATLTTGTYTVYLTGVANVSGVGMIEVYEVP